MFKLVTRYDKEMYKDKDIDDVINKYKESRKDSITDDELKKAIEKIQKPSKPKKKQDAPDRNGTLKKALDVLDEISRVTKA